MIAKSLTRFHQTIQAMFSYLFLFRSHGGRLQSSGKEQALNKQLKGYPRNHDYQVCGRIPCPGFRLYERLRLVKACYPDRFERYLDVGCCRGFYVLDAARRRGVKAAIGIDVHKPFIDISNRVKDYLRTNNVGFFNTSLKILAKEPEAFGGPFQVILLLGTYHYLFWGSQLCADAYYDHREIFSMLSKICDGKLIISGRTELHRLPFYLKELAKYRSCVANYNTAFFLKAAAEFFDIKRTGYLGAYPLYVMSKKMMA